MASLEQRKISELLHSIESEMKGIMSSRKMDASGQARGMIESVVRDNEGTLFAPDYIEFMERGRGPGKFPPLEDIKQWIVDKGIKSEIPNESLAFLIGRKMAEEGSVLHIKGQKSGVLSQTITPERIDTFFQNYAGEKFIEVTKELRLLLRV